MTLRVLIGSPDNALSRVVSAALEQADYETTVVDGVEAVSRGLHGTPRPDMLLLDMTFPDDAALDVCRRMRNDTTTRDIPIMMVASPGAADEKVRALEAGADDCVTRPVQLDEFIARVRALCRRAIPEPAGSHVRAGPIDMDLGRWTVTVNERPTRLTKKEFRLLQVLLEAKGRVLSRDALLEQAWPHSSIHGLDTRTVDVHIGRLRRKLGAAGQNIITVRNVGFRFDVLPEWITGHQGITDEGVNHRSRRS